MKSPLSKILLVIVILLYELGLVFYFAWLYTSLQLQVAQSKGIYSSPEAGMQSIIESGYVGIEKIIIDHAGRNSYLRDNPRVWADHRVSGAPLGNGRSDFDFPGAFRQQAQPDNQYLRHPRLVAGRRSC